MPLFTHFLHQVSLATGRRPSMDAISSPSPPLLSPKVSPDLVDDAYSFCCNFGPNFLVSSSDAWQPFAHFRHLQCDHYFASYVSTFLTFCVLNIQNGNASFPGRLVGFGEISTTPSQNGQISTDFYFFNCSCFFYKILC